MVRLRLARFGTKKKPFYRVVAADQRAPRNGRLIEQIGWYDPMKNPHQIHLDLAKIDGWIKVGAQPTDTVRDLIARYRKQAGQA